MSAGLVLAETDRGGRLLAVEGRRLHVQQHAARLHMRDDGRRRDERTTWLSLPCS